MARVLKTGGRVHVGEIYPPEGGKGSTGWIMDSDYDSFGLTKEVYARGRINEFLEDHRMRIPPPRNDEFPFFVTLTKK